MRVLLLGAYPPPHGGLQTHLASLRRFLRQRSIGCAVINTTRAPESGDEEVYYPRSAAAFLRLLAHLEADIVHVHVGGDLTPRLLGLLLICAMRPRSRSLLTFHSGGYPSSPGGQTARPRTLRGFVFRRFDRLIAVNSELQALYEKFGVDAARVRLIQPHALPPSPPEAEFPDSLARFFDHHPQVLITVGLLEPEYDLPLQIDELAAVRERFPGAGLLIVGSGSLEADLDRYIAAKPYSAHILLYGDMPHPVTLQAIARASALLRTTFYDGDSVAVREALHFGTPVIATDNGMRPAGVHLIPRGDRQALVQAIVAELVNPHARSGLPQAANQNLEAILAVYRELT